MESIFPPRAVGAIQPTNRLHLGNYFGAVLTSLNLESYCARENFCFIADYHAQTAITNKDHIQDWTVVLASELLAIGLDPQLTTIYRQSDIPEVMEVMWLLALCMPSSELARGHKMQGGAIATAGVYLYPLLMAADILGVRATMVPIGDDQHQHLERARDAARRFNRLVDSALLPIPVKIDGISGFVPGIDAAPDARLTKMSKSLDNIIPVFCRDEEVEEYVNKIRTRPAKWGEPIDPDAEAIYRLYQLVATDDNVQEMHVGFKTGKLGYDDAKKMLARSINDYFAPIRARAGQFKQRRDYVLSVLEIGASRVREEMRTTLDLMRAATGIATIARGRQR